MGAAAHAARFVLLPMALLACSVQGDGTAEPAPPAGAPSTEARLVIAPHTGPPGTPVELTATGFPPSSPVVIGIGPPQSEYTEIRTEQTDSTGRLNTTAALPQWVESSRTYLWVVADPTSRPRAISEPFLVTDASAEEQAPAGSILLEGQITDEGVECPAFRSDAGDLYTLAGAPADLQPSDRVRIIGTIAEVSTCQQGATLRVQRIDKL